MDVRCVSVFSCSGRTLREWFQKLAISELEGVIHAAVRVVEAKGACAGIRGVLCQ